MSHDVLDGIALAIEAFRRANLAPPSAIYLESPEEGRNFLLALAQTNFMYLDPGSRFGTPVETASGAIYMQIKVNGIAINWPANKLANPDGSWAETPTEEMVIAGFECEAWDKLATACVEKGGWPYTCKQSAEAVTEIYKAMRAAQEASK